MLQSYSLEGFLSINNLIEIDLKKSQYQILEKTNVENGLLKGCMFVGGNASGKTNLIEGLWFLLRVLFEKSEVNWNNYLCLFSETQIFENTYSFLIDGETIQYWLRYQKERRFSARSIY